MANIERINAVMIYTQEPEKLAAWYAHFGIQAPFASGGGLFGEAGAPSSAFAFGLIPPREGVPVTGHGAITLTFKVTDFAGFLAELAVQGIMPIETQDNDNGHFALFRDPEGNYIELWSEED